jgi:NIMA (never in mitosis gene a)-related kinase
MLLSASMGDNPTESRKVGTPFYLAPELWESNNYSKKSDIWSLGIILYEICTHKCPYQANTMDELKEKVLKDKYAPIPMTVHKQLSEIIQKCLHKKPENRISIEEIIQ